MGFYIHSITDRSYAKYSYLASQFEYPIGQQDRIMEATVVGEHCHRIADR